MSFNHNIREYVGKCVQILTSFFWLLFRYYNVLTSAKMPPTNSENGFDRWWTFFAAISQHTYIIYVGYSTSMQELLVNFSSTPCHFFSNKFPLLFVYWDVSLGREKRQRKLLNYPMMKQKNEKRQREQTRSGFEWKNKTNAYHTNR